MPQRISFDEYALDFDDLYRRMWEIGFDAGDGTKVYRPTPEQAVKWLIAELAGTPAVPGKTVRANNQIRRQVYEELVEGGWAERETKTSWRLLRPPADVADPAAMVPPSPSEDPDDDGQQVDDVAAAAVTDATGNVELGALTWSTWHPLSQAVKSATTSPGVYLARVDGEIAYVGMAGERRGRGVRGRLTVYARGRAAVSGLGEAALDRALADESWLEERLNDLRRDGPTRAKEWAVAAMSRRPIEVCWAAAESTDQARTWEQQVLIDLEDVELWNRARPRATRDRPQ